MLCTSDNSQQPEAEFGPLIIWEIETLPSPYPSTPDPIDITHA